MADCLEQVNDLLGALESAASMLRGHGWGFDHLGPEAVPAAVFLLFVYVYVFRILVRKCPRYVFFLYLMRLTKSLADS